MKIFYLSPTFYPAKSLGGPTISSWAKCKLLSKSKNQVDVYTTNTDGDKRMEIANGQRKKINKYFAIHYYNEIIRNYLSFGLYQKISFRLKKYDFIIIDDLFSGYSLMTLYLCIMMKKKFVIIPRGVLSKWSLNNGKKYIKFILIKFLIKPFQSKITWEATSLEEKNQIKSIFNSSKIIILNNGIELRNYQKIKKLKKNIYLKKFAKEQFSNKKIITSLGRLHHVKNLDVLVTAFSKIYKKNKKLLLLIAGNDAGVKGDLLKLIKKLNICESVKFVGHLNFSDKIKFLKGADLFICISKSENFANVVLEATACKTPSIVSQNVPWKILEDYRCGKQIKVTRKNLIEAMEYYLKKKKTTHKNYIKLAGKFDLNELIQKTDKIYKRINL